MEIINSVKSAVELLKQGKIVAYPTDTSYGLAVDVTNTFALKKFYKIKERGFDKPVHIVVPNISYAKQLVNWNQIAQKLAKAFWPGALTLVLELKDTKTNLTILTAKTGFLGLRMPDNQMALQLVKKLGAPITATSANPSAHLSGGYDSYSPRDIIDQFKDKKFQPDAILDAGKLKKRKPSTLVKISDGGIEILRKGPISEREIKLKLQGK